MIDTVRTRSARRPAAPAPAIAPIAKAIRLGLAVSTMALALGSPLAVQAAAAAPAVHVPAAPAPVASSAYASPAFPDPVDQTLVSDDRPASAVHDGLALGITARDDGPVIAALEVDVVNDIDISHFVAPASGDAFVSGLVGAADERASVVNNASIDVGASSVDGDAIAYGAIADATLSGISVLINAGDIAAEASAAAGAAYATAEFAYGDVASVFNDGNAAATATATGGAAFARAARVYAAYAAIENAGTLTATATATGGDATAIGADSFGYFGSYVDNAGDIDALAQADGGNSVATGIYSIGFASSSYVFNTGTVTAESHGDAAVANGIVSASLRYGHGVVVNDGNVSALAVGGIAAYGETEALAFGIYASAFAYSSVVENNGNVVAEAQALADIDIADGLLTAQSIGIAAVNQYGIFDTVVYNDGAVTSSADVSLGFATSWGVAAQSSGAYGGASVIANDGDINAYAHVGVGVASATGAYTQSIFGLAGVANYGDILAVAETVRGIVNVSVNYADAYGVKVVSYYGDAVVENAGSVTSVARSYGAINSATGVLAQGDASSVHNAEGATITAIGDAQGFGLGSAAGIVALGTHQIDIVNDGTVIAYGHAQALNEGDAGFYGASSVMGIYAVANMYGNIGIVNNGDVLVTAHSEHSESFFQGGAGATGIQAYAKYDADIVNNGRIVVSADSELGIVSGYGIVGEGKYSTGIVNNGDVLVTAANGSSPDDSYGGRAIAMGIKAFNSDHVSIANYANVIVHATATADAVYAGSPALAQTWGIEAGAYSRVQDAIIDNRAVVESVASADFGAATAYGTFVETSIAADTVNSGSVLASAIASHGDAWTVGAFDSAVQQQYVVPCDAYGCDYGSAYFITIGGASHLANTGAITALADAEGGIATAYGAVQLGGFLADIGNDGDIRARATADTALAVGVLANSFVRNAAIANTGLVAAEAIGTTATATGAQLLGGETGVALGQAASTLVNGGDIVARAEGDTATATGVTATDRGLDGVSVENSGTILAGAYGDAANATAVQLDSFGVNTLVNTGTISALGDGERFAVRSSAGARADLHNSGDLIGAIATGDLADAFANDGTWWALGASTFGAGADVVANSGTLVLDSASIDFGGDAGDAFTTFGGVIVRGDGNLIDVGGGMFTNDGWISLVDGDTGGRLGISGTVAGSGNLLLDVDALAGTSDMVTINGSMAANAVQTLDLNVLSRPDTENYQITLATVSGTSIAGNFALGQVAFDPGFVTVDLDLVADIDASNGRADVFALGVAVTGLNGTGKLAAALSPGVQSLVDAQVGTWRQRMGVLPRTSAGGPDAWIRAFSSNGDIDADHSGMGADATLAIDQSSHGYELGIDLALNEHVSVGVLAGNAEATSRLVDDAGSNRLDSKTFGLYATWQAENGFYLDVSQRWTGVDAQLRAGGSRLRTDVDADTFNVEAGFAAWTWGGVGVTPQLQYTRSNVGEVSPVHVGASVYEDAGGLSSRGRLGVMFDRTFSGGSVALTPYASLNVVREFEGDYDHAINGGVTGTTSTDGTAAMLELGLGARSGGLSVTGGVSWTDGGAQDGVVGGQLSLRYAW